MMGVIFVPQFSENCLKLSTGSGGYLVIILGLFAGLGAPVSGKLIDRYGAKLIIAFGFASSIAGALFMMFVTTKHPSEEEYSDLVFANKIVKHSRSNAMVLAKGLQLCASGIGQTSRIDALRQAIDKARAFGFSLEGAVMASDAFFPFPDSVTTAHEAGITAVVQPGGSVRDQESIDYCNKTGVAMVFTGIRHFKH